MKTSIVKNYFFYPFFALLIFLGGNVWGQTSIIPIRDQVTGFGTWTDNSVGGTTYLQLLSSTSSTISPAFNLNIYTSETLDFKARTFGGTSGSSNVITISISVDNGGTWTVLGTRTPSNSTLNSMTQFDLSSYSGTQVKIKFESLSGTNSNGVGIDNIELKGSTPTFSVTYNENSSTGGSVPTDASSPYTTGSTVTVLGNTGTLVKTGFTFDGWNTTAGGGGTDYSPSSTFTISSNTTLYAKWISATGKNVTFNANGGTGTMPIQNASSATNLTSNTFTRAGYTFTGWNTASNGSGTAYANGVSYSFAADLDLYAQWSANTNTITFDANGGTGSMSNQSINTDASANLTANSFSRTGYTFSGWATTAGGTSSYSNSASYTMGTANVTLYAVWTANNYTVSFDGNGSTSGSMSNQTIAAFASANLTANAFLKTGFTFAGWATTAGGAVTYADGASYTMATANVTLYAQWTVYVGPCLEELFTSLSGNNTTTGGSSTAWTGNSNFSTSTVYQAGDAVRLGSGSNVGVLTSSSLTTVSGDITVSFKVKGWSSIEGNIKVTLGGVEQTVTYTATMSDAFETKTVLFTGVASGQTLIIETTAKRAFIDDIQLFCASAGAEINLKGNSNSIVSGDITPSLTDHTDFGSVAVVGGTQARIFTIENTGGADLTVSAVSSSNSSEFAVSGIALPITITAGNSTTFTVTFDPSALGARTSTMTITSDDSDEGTYTFAIQGNGVNSASSDIIATSGFAYTSNIDYTLFQGNPVSNTTNGVASFGFTIRDGAGASDADALGTELTAITFATTNSANIRSAALFDGTTFIANASSISGGDINFTGLSGANVTAADNGTKDLILYVSFLTSVTDNAQLQYTVSSATANASGSVFSSVNASGATSSITGDRNRLEVTATKVVFLQQPTNTSVNGTMSPSPQVSATDANGNVDLDYTASVSISSDGTMTGSPISVSASAGVASFNSVVHTVVGTGFKLTATSGSLTSALSSAFNITTIVYTNGDYRTTGSGSWVSNNATPAIWERLVSGVWTTSNSPSFNTSNTIYIRDGHTITSGGSYGNSVNVKIMDGGTFNNNHPSTMNSIYIYEGGNLKVNSTLTINATFDVEDNGNVYINYSANGASSIWDGTENFRPNSNFIFQNWNSNAATEEIFTSTNVTTNTYAGYTAGFGNMIFDFTSDTGNDLDIVEPGVNANLAHGNLHFVTPPFNVATPRKINVATTGTITTGIGGDFIVDDLYENTAVVQIKTSGTMNFTIKGDMQLDGATTRIFPASVSGATCTVNIDGNLNITPSAVLDYNSSTAAGINMIINLKGDVTVAGSGLLQNSNASSQGQFNFVGPADGDSPATTQEVDIASTSGNENRHIDFNVKSGTYVRLINRNFEMGKNGGVNVEDGGTFDFGFNGTTALNVMKSGTQTGTYFKTFQGSTLKITNPDGISTTGDIGNVQQIAGSNRTFHQTATFWYIGKENQVTGNGITTTTSAKVVICDLIDNNTQLRFTNSIQINGGTTISPTGGKLDIRKGQVIETTTEYVTGSTGTLYMSAGTLYYIPKGSADAGTSNGDLIPRLDGSAFNYNLIGGTIQFDGVGASDAFQTLRGSKTYHNLLFSGANTYLTDYKNLSNDVIVNSQVELTGTTVVDCINSSLNGKSFTGNGGLKMSGTSRLRIKKFGIPNPELLGTANPYDLASGTIEFYGTGNTDNQILRGVFNGSSTIMYNHLEIKADAQNDEYSGDFYNVSPAANFGLKGNMQVYSPAVFRFDALESVSGIGNIQIDAGATLLYGSENGLTASGTSTTDGNVRVSGTRTFPTTASYGFVGAQDQVSGNGLPTTMVNLYVVKSSAATLVTLTNDLTMNTKLHFQQGNVVTNGKLFELGTSTANKGTLTYIDGFAIGSMRRWFNGTNSGISTGLFPMGADDSGLKNRHVQVEFSAAPSSGGHLTATFISSTMGNSGLPLLAPAATGGFAYDVTSTEDQGYWKMDNEASKLTDGAYTISCTGEGFQTITNLAKLTLLKRVVANSPNWFCPGVHESPTGTTAKPTVSRSGVSGWSNFGFGGADVNPLPVELTRFEANCVENETVLSWETASEQQAEKFILETSSDALFWQKLEEIPAHGNSSTTQTYEARNKQRELTYYRLLQRDFNGNIHDYGIVVSDCGLGDDIRVFPNPMHDQVTFLYLPESTAGLTIEIFAADGRIVKVLSTKNNSAVLDINELNSGIYTYSIRNTQNKIKQGKLIKL